VLRDYLSDEQWLVHQCGHDPATANTYETLFTVGNGYLGTRGALEEGHLGSLSGTFLAGVYDTHDSDVAALVNAPDWVCATVFVDGMRLDTDCCDVVDHQRALDLHRGLLWRRTTFRDAEGRRTTVESLRFASMHDRGLCGLRMEVTPLDHAAVVTVESALDGRRRNLERLPAYPADATFEPHFRWEKWARSKHLHQARTTADVDGVHLRMTTRSGGVELAYSAVLEASHSAKRRLVVREHEAVTERCDYVLDAGEMLRLDKLVTISTSRDVGVDEPDPATRSVHRLRRHRRGGWLACMEANVHSWSRLWLAADCEIVGDSEAAKAVRFGVYHLLIAANPDDPTVSVGAKSLSGEGYRGHVFWDSEIVMLPFYLYTNPEHARALLGYRHHTLPAARALARETGGSGARFAWESADTGEEQCPRWTVDGVHRFWTREQEVHISADVAYGIATYLEATHDLAYLGSEGLEVLIETARYWMSRCQDSPDTDTVHLRTVMGPDEFHSHVDDNAFTNTMVRWHLQWTAQVSRRLALDRPDMHRALSTRLGLLEEEPDRWENMADRLARPRVTADGVVEQFDGYFQRADLPIAEWDHHDMPQYPAGYHHFNLEDTMLLKQPDVLMMMVLHPGQHDHAALGANYAFYEPRTLHKSSLSPAVHAIVAAQLGDESAAMRYFDRSAYVDLRDNQGNTAEGMHVASAAGTWQIVVRGFGGFRIEEERPSFRPRLPAAWRELRFSVSWRGSRIACVLGQESCAFTLHSDEVRSQHIVVDGTVVRLTHGEPRIVVTLPQPRTRETVQT